MMVTGFLVLMWCSFLVWTVLVSELSQQVYTAPSLSLEYCMIGTYSCQIDVVSMDCVGPCYSRWEW